VITDKPFLKRLFKQKNIRFEGIVALSVFALGLMLSIVGFTELQAISKERLYLETEKYARAQVEQIQTKLNISLDSLKNVAALYSSTGEISSNQLARFVDTDTQYHDGTIGLAWVARVSYQQKNQFEQKVQAKGERDFQIHEITAHGFPSVTAQGLPIDVDNAQEYFPIRSLFPSSVGDLTLGLNMASIPSRLNIIDKARKNQQTAVTQRLSIFHNDEHRYGFQAYHPVFTDTESWQQQLVGFVVGIYDFAAFFSDSFEVEQGQLKIGLYDGNSSSQQLLYSSSDEFNTVDDIKFNKNTHWIFPLIVADKQWLLAVFPQKNGASFSQLGLPYIGLFAGSLLTLLLTVYLFISLVKSRQVTELATDLAGTTSQLEIQRQLKSDADRANMAKSQLLRAASHDLRQPLHTIGLLTSLLKDSVDQKEQQHLTQRISQAVDGMNTMFGALLDISLLEAGSLQVKPKHFYLQTVLDKLLLEFEIQAEQKALKLAVVDSEVCIYTDQLLLEQILRNLLSNAIRYTEQGKVVLSCRRIEHAIRICVIDTGIGMSDESQVKLFDEFYRDEQARQMSDKGLGLGLSIVAKTVEKLALNFGFQSTLAKGSTFYIDVPYGDSRWVKEPVVELDVQASIQKNIWIIEDDDDGRFGMEQLLKHWGCTVLGFASSEALEHVLQQSVKRPDKIIADYQLINETGLSLVQQIQAHYHKAIPTLIITGTTDPQLSDELIENSCESMVKPVKSSDLYHWLAKR
jgi:signal transduction histidine kinase/CheY-like chemotaxis protein